MALVGIALKYALRTSMKLILRGLPNLCLSEAYLLNRIRFPSRGGVLADKASLRSPWFSSQLTSLALTSGLIESPLLQSTHLERTNM